MTLSQQRFWLINKLEETDFTKRNIRAQIRERSSNDKRTKDRAFRQWKYQADDKIAAVLLRQQHYRNKLGEVNRALKERNRQPGPANHGRDAALALRFMETAKQHLSDIQFHQLLQLAEGSLRESD